MKLRTLDEKGLLHGTGMTHLPLGVASDFNTLVTSSINSVSCHVGKGRLKEWCELEPRTNFFQFKKSSKTECRLDSGAEYIREYTVYNLKTMLSRIYIVVTGGIFQITVACYNLP
jgi:hypothetical protein